MFPLFSSYVPVFPRFYATTRNSLANLLSATGSYEFNLATRKLPGRDGTRAVEAVKAGTIQPRSLFVRLQQTKVSVKFTCTGDRLAIKASEMTLPDI